VKTYNNILAPEDGKYPLITKMRLMLATWIGKVVNWALRLLRRGGTTLPGRIALIICPELLTIFAKQLSGGNIIITGTNGKTTAASFLTAIIEEAGYTSINNQAGSNMNWGISSAMVKAADWRAHLRADYGIMEVDEGNFPLTVQHLHPKGVVVTNIFRDQLDRYGDIDYIKKALKKGIAENPQPGFTVINADDPSLADITESGPNNKIYTYGLEFAASASDPLGNTAKDLKTCPRCHLELSYSTIYYAHLGHFYCPGCSYKRKKPDLSITGISSTDNIYSTIDITWQDVSYQVYFPLPGRYNLYNLMAAVTCAHVLDIDPLIIKKAINNVEPPFGRMEKFFHNNAEIIMALIKNPVGANESLNTFLAGKDKIYNTMLIAINDNIPDGRDISWIWDVDFEQIDRSGHRFHTIVVSGLRALDTALRLKYAGISEESLMVESNTRKALNRCLAMAKEGSCLVILPNYSAMLEIRREMNKMGIGSRYWEV